MQALSYDDCLKAVTYQEMSAFECCLKVFQALQSIVNGLSNVTNNVEGLATRNDAIRDDVHHLLCLISYFITAASIS